MVPTNGPLESQNRSSEEKQFNLKRLEIGFWVLALLLGFSHVWSDPHYLVNSDAMSYLDIAEAYLRRDWSSAVSAYWSPLYSWLIALALWVTKPSPYWKFTFLHLLNFGIYCFALGCFSFLTREMLRRNRRQRAVLHEIQLVTFPAWGLLAIAYSLFIWSSLFLVTISVESPDMLVAASLYLASGVLLRIQRQPSSWIPFIYLGLILGVGYLAKSVMLPMALIFAIASLFAVGNFRRAIPRVLLTVVLFVLVAAPFVVAVSRSKGRLSTGETGRLNYLWAINRVPYFHWQGEEPGSGTPTHPTRKIFDAPPAFEFGEPVQGTYPVWYDPTYWYEGSVRKISLRQQLQAFAQNIMRLYELLHKWGVQYGLLVGVLSLYVLSRKRRLILDGLISQWALLFPALAGLGLYSAVFVHGRYVAPFLVLLWLALFSAVRLRQTPDAEKFISAISIVLGGLIILTTIASSSGEIIATGRRLVTAEDRIKHEQWHVAEGLREMGVVSSDKVASIGDTFRAFWAHLLGIRIVAEVRKDKVGDFWQADTTSKKALIQAFYRVGAKAIVAEKPPTGVDLTGWRKIRQTDYYVYIVEE